jgi:hypothetical protein
VSHQTLDGPRRRIAQGADSAAFDLFAVGWGKKGVRERTGRDEVRSRSRQFE